VDKELISRGKVVTDGGAATAPHVDKCYSVLNLGYRIYSEVLNTILKPTT
jgi:hypothetical protein